MSIVFQGSDIVKYLYLGSISLCMAKNNDNSNPVYVSLTNAEYQMLESITRNKGYRSNAETLRMLFRDMYMKE
jgi:hypothetical protein